MKLVKRLVLLLIVGLVLLVVAGGLLVKPASRAAVESGGEYALGVPTTLEEVELSPGFGRSALGFRGLSIANPEGIPGDPFLEIGRFQVGVRTFSLMSSTVKVPEVELGDLHLRLIQDGQRSNFREILAHVRSLGGGGGAEAPPAAEGEGGAGPSLALGTLNVRDVTATVELRGVPGLEPVSKTYALPDFDWDVAAALGAGDAGDGSARPASLGEITAALVDHLIELGVLEAGSELDPAALAVLEAGLTDLDGALEQLEDKAAEEAEGLLEEAAGKVEEELGGKLKGVLGGGD